MSKSVNQNIKVIFSDLFGVLIGPNYNELIKYINIITGESENIIYQKLFDERSMQYIRGEITFDYFFNALQYNIINGSLIKREKFKYYWDTMQIGPTAVIEKLLKIKNKYKIYILTNTNNEHIKKLKKKFIFLKQFDGIITSEKANSYKPNKEIFQYACHVAEIKFNQAILIDDSLLNIKAAKNLGMRCHLYGDFSSFSKFIDKLF